MAQDKPQDNGYNCLQPWRQDLEYANGTVNEYEPLWDISKPENHHKAAFNLNSGIGRGELPLEPGPLTLTELFFPDSDGFWPLQQPCLALPRKRFDYIWRNLHFIGGTPMPDEEDDIDEELNDDLVEENSGNEEEEEEEEEDEDNDVSNPEEGANVEDTS
eukprot:scaffold602_cov124-Amphora_coffeaeformis.AAC.1